MLVSVRPFHNRRLGKVGPLGKAGKIIYKKRLNTPDHSFRFGTVIKCISMCSHISVNVYSHNY